ncbi:two-pore potassium channel 1 [Dorcoceras hygrometricum]|uniref:Two-pore potassium channel 1 n=1 Tax=Dorcoceras hygrometricum TaxID=472368 RepID=A0A2Z7BM81_9LAMI|nr:two-pore potassium channel 1 [Dorcoceras hygrometricum]
MDKSDVCDPLLAPVADSAYQSSSSAALKKRKYRRCKSVPVENADHPEQHLDSSPRQPSSIFTDNPDFKRVLVFLAAYLGIGSLCFFLISHHIEGNKTNGIIDAVYFCVVTMTTVGYGDLVPDSVLSKLLACVFVFIGMAIVGFLLSKAADYIVEKQEIIMVQAMHMHDKCSPVEILETNRAKYKVITALALLLFLVCSGILFLSLKEGLDLFDAFYCVCATITTLGYVAELYTERRRQSLVNWVLSRKLTVSDLEAADLDNDKVVSYAEFVVYKLKEMGKISEEDIAVVMAGFKSLDIDHSGTLTKADLLNSE